MNTSKNDTTEDIIDDNSDASASSSPSPSPSSETPENYGSGQNKTWNIHQKLISQVNTKVTNAESEIANLKDEINQSKNAIKKMKSSASKAIEEFKTNSSTEIDSIKKDLKSDKERVIQTLAVFVGLFTFVSVNFAFLANKILLPEYFLSFNFVLGGFLLLFILLLRLLTYENISWDRKEVWLTIIALLLIFSGICSYWAFYTKNKSNIAYQQKVIITQTVLQSSPSAILVPTETVVQPW